MGFNDTYIKNFKLYLGSRSPRRDELLKGLGLDFKIWIKEELEENYPDNLIPEEIALYLARIKARQYLQELKTGDVLITADTIVALGDEILNKPNSREEAIDSLERLSGKSHIVITGICLSSPEKTSCFSAQTSVKFAELNSDEIEFYIDNYTPYDKAGAYGIQEWIGYIGVESITGSYFNVMGLPVQRLFRELKKFTGYAL